MRFSQNSRPYLIWACAAVFYVYQFVLRVSPSLVVDDLMIYFQLDASGVSHLSALAMYSYALMQIPSGLLVDSFGVRKVLLGSILVCITGVSVFVLSDSLLVAKVGRILLGAGSASAFLCVCKVSVEWFPQERRATLLGMTMAMGTVGAYFGSRVLSILIQQFGWKLSLLSTNGLGLVILVFGYFIIPDRSLALATSGSTNALVPLIQLLKDRKIWIYSLTALGIYLCISVIADLWGVSFIVQALGTSKIVANQTVSLMYVGLCLGSLVLTSLGDYFKARQLLIRLCIGLLFVLSAVLIYFPMLPQLILSLLLFLIGFLSGAEMLCFADLSDRVGKVGSATATGLMNCVVMIGGAFVAEQIGRLLDVFWKGAYHVSGIRLYTLSEYQRSLSLVVLIILISAFVSIFLPKKNSLAY